MAIFNKANPLFRLLIVILAVTVMLGSLQFTAIAAEEPIGIVVAGTYSTGTNVNGTGVHMRDLPEVAFGEPTGTTVDSTVVVDTTNKHQQFEGMGISLEETSIHNISQLSKEVREELLTRLVKEWNFSLFRLSIGANDCNFRFPFWSNDSRSFAKENERQYDLDVEDDFDLEYFSIQLDHDLNIVENVKFIQSLNPDVKFFASAWSPPSWMKEIRYMNQGTTKYNDFVLNPDGSYKVMLNDDGTPVRRYKGWVEYNTYTLPSGGTNRRPEQMNYLRDDCIDALADYYLKYVLAYKDLGIDIYALTILNEPGADVAYSAMNMTIEQHQLVAKAVKKRFADNGLDTLLWAHDWNINDWYSQKNDSGTTINDATEDNHYRVFLDSSVATKEEMLAAYGGVALHPYDGGPNRIPTQVIPYVGDMKIHNTESNGFSGANLVDWFRYGTSSYVAWTSLTDRRGGTHYWYNNPNKNNNQYDNPTPQSGWTNRIATIFYEGEEEDYYVFGDNIWKWGQISKYLTSGSDRPGGYGAVRVDCTVTGNSNVTGVAFENPNGEIVLILNNSNNNTARTVRVNWEGKSFVQTLAANSLSTMVWRPGVDSSFIDEQPSDVFYEIFVRAFCDSDGDGVGDFKGLESKLSYLKDLGITGIWLMPITKNGSYHGYDTEDYYEVCTDYGTMQDFEEMVATANKLGIKILMDLVISHSSNRVSYFTEFAKGPDNDNPFWNWYKWSLRSDTSVRVDNAVGSPTGSPWRNLSGLGNLYRYIGIFTSNMPCLNFDNPAVREEMKNVGQYWLEKGVSGYRLDAAKHIFGKFAGTVHSPEIVQKNMDWWIEFREAMKEVNPNVYLIGEIWEEDTSLMLPFIEALQSTFDFKQAIDMLAMSSTEKAMPEFTSKLSRLYDDFGAVSEYDFLNCTFLTNHDQNRVMSVLDSNFNHAKTAAAMLLTLPGNPFIYYGEEVGLTGRKPDEDIREPMPWYESNSGPGLTNWKPQYRWSNRYSFGGAISVEAQEKDPASLLNRYKELISWRRELRVLRDGDVAVYESGNEKILSYVRMTHNDRVLVATNLSGDTVSMALDQTKAFSPFTGILKKFALDSASKLEGDILTIAPYSTVVLGAGEAVPSIYLTVSMNASAVAEFTGNVLVNATPFGFVPSEPITVSLVDSQGKTIGSGVADGAFNAVVKSPVIPYSGEYTLKAVSGDVVATCPIEVVPRPGESWWLPTLSPSGTNANSGGTYIKFGAIPRHLVECLNFDGDITIDGVPVTTGTFVYKADNATFDECTRVYIPRTRNSLAGSQIVIKNVVFKDVFPNYAFTFTVDVP